MFRRFKERKLQDLGLRERTVNPEFDAKVNRFNKTDAALAKVHQAATAYANALSTLGRLGKELTGALMEYYALVSAHLLPPDLCVFGLRHKNQ